MNAYTEMIDRIRRADCIGCIVSSTGAPFTQPMVTLVAHDEQGTQWTWGIETEEALEVIETALSEWGWNELFSAVVQAQLYHALLLEREFQVSREHDEIPFS